MNNAAAAAIGTIERPSGTGQGAPAEQVAETVTGVATTCASGMSAAARAAALTCLSVAVGGTARVGSDTAVAGWLSDIKYRRYGDTLHFTASASGTSGKGSLPIQECVQAAGA